MAEAPNAIVKLCFSGCVRLLISAAILALFGSQALAGYTHYYTWIQQPDAAALKDCVAEMNRIIEARKSILVSPDLPDSKPGVLNLGSTNVDFNGIGEEAHEPFVFPFFHPGISIPGHEGFNFCKTAYKPYDEVVTACLIVARDHFPPSVLAISSDGSWADWSRGAKLYSSVLGRRARNPMAARGFNPVSARRKIQSYILISILGAGLGFFFWQKRSSRYSKAWRQSFQ